jgi:hypothetical protein
MKFRVFGLVALVAMMIGTSSADAQWLRGRRCCQPSSCCASADNCAASCSLAAPVESCCAMAAPVASCGCATACEPSCEQPVAACGCESSCGATSVETCGCQSSCCGSGAGGRGGRLGGFAPKLIGPAINITLQSVLRR